VTNNKGILCTIDNLTIHHRTKDLFELRLKVDSYHYLHCALGLDDCRIVRNEMLGWDIDNALIVEDEGYYRLEFLWHTDLLSPEDLDLRFHSEKLNLASVVAVYDMIIKNEKVDEK